MDDWKKRVTKELEELEEKTIKLENFIWDEETKDSLEKGFTANFRELSNKNQALLIMQLHSMYNYVEILRIRIELF